MYKYVHCTGDHMDASHGHLLRNNTKNSISARIEKRCAEPKIER